MDDAPLDVGEVTRLLRAARDGEAAAVERLVPLVYDDLRRLARRCGIDSLAASCSLLARAVPSRRLRC